MRIATWNVNSLKARMPRVEEWIEYAEPDVLCLQETKLSDATFPTMAFSALGYESVHHGSGQWNGVAVLSKVGIDDVVEGFCEGVEADQDTRLVTAACGGVRVTSVYVPNGRALDDPHYEDKLSWLARLRDHLDATADPDGLVAVWGDFHNHRGMRIDLILVSKPLAERVEYALVDRFARKGKLPSDHAPLFVDVDV